MAHISTTDVKPQMQINAEPIDIPPVPPVIPKNNKVEDKHKDDDSDSDEESGIDLPSKKSDKSPKTSISKPVIPKSVVVDKDLMKDLNDIQISTDGVMTTKPCDIPPINLVAAGDNDEDNNAVPVVDDHVLDYKSPDTNPNIAPASLWNRQDIVEFKAAIRKDGPEGIIKVGHGETVTIRVPTHEEGNSLFWEFATDHYDLGFGVLFEWTVAETNQVTVHVSESSDEEAEEEGIPEGGIQGTAPGDVESGTPRQIRHRDPNKPRQDEIIPIYRRDCHEEVYAGSHTYPGRGVYLLKFDNSYSLWRSKSLYYRVYYSK